jgi:hypothetical protein
VAALLPDLFYSDVEDRCVAQEETQLEADFRHVGPAFLVGLEEAARKGWIDNVTISLDFWDSQCSLWGLIGSWEALQVTDMPDLLLGPSCDVPLYYLFALEEWKRKRVPVLTGGGMAARFSRPKQLANETYYMLTKTGASFTDAAKAFVRFMQENGWSKFVLAYRKTQGRYDHDHDHDHLEWTGDYSCDFLATAVTDQAEAAGLEWTFLELEPEVAVSPSAGMDIREHYIETNKTWLKEELQPTNKR